MIAETFVELVKDPNHWLFEIMLMVIFDGLLMAGAVPLFRRWLKNHDEKKHAHEHCDDVHDVEPKRDGSHWDHGSHLKVK